MESRRQAERAPRIVEPAPRAGRGVRLGVLTNPTAQHNHRFPFTHQNLTRHLASEADAVVTADKSQIDGAVRHLLLDREVSVLAINGGDGTIHGAINSIASLLGADVLAGRAVLPALLLLNGGTYNMASRAMGTKGPPVQTVRRFQARFRESPIGGVAMRDVGLLEVRRPGRPAMSGMFFGSQVVANALELCDQMGSGYFGLLKLLSKGTAGYLLRTPFWREHAWRLHPQDLQATVDGQSYSDASAVVAATVDMKLARGMVWALTTSGAGRGFHAKVVRAKTGGDVVHLLPHLLWEIGHPMIAAFPEATRVETAGRFTLDGELYDHEGPIEIVPSPLRFRVVSGDAL